MDLSKNVRKRLISILGLIVIKIVDWLCAYKDLSMWTVKFTTHITHPTHYFLPVHDSIGW